jgi:PAS domain S-box-containing protein
MRQTCPLPFVRLASMEDKLVEFEMAIARSVRKMTTKLFDGSIASTPEQALDFISSILASSTEYSIIGKDLDGGIVLWNEGARRIYGYEADEVLGVAHASILHEPEDAKAGLPRAMLDTALHKGKWEGKVKRRRKNGQPFTARVVVTPRRDGRGRAIGFLLISKDISDEIRLARLEREVAEHKWAEGARRYAELRFRRMADSAPVLMWISGTDKRHTWFNQQWLTFTGRTMEQESGDGWEAGVGWIEGVHSEDLKGYLDAYSSAFDAREEFQTEYRLRRHDGEWRWVAARGVPSFAIDGGFLGYIGTCIDITDRKCAQDQLAQSRQQMWGIIEAARDAIISIDTEQRIVLFNAAAEQTFQRSSAEMLGQSLAQLIPERFRAIHGKHVDAFAQTGVSSRVMGELSALTALRGDGNEFPIEASISQAKVDDRTLFTVILRDITERMRHDERRETLVSELNHRVKNTLAVVQSLARQTLATVSGLDAFEQAFIVRIQALARAHDLLTRADWVSTTLGEVVRHALSCFDIERFEIAGPRVVLDPRAAVTLILALNELATNAAKYGALSEPAGHVEVKWREQTQDIELLWQERGGPSVVPPARRGFGSQMIEQTIAFEFDGESELAFPHEGATCRMRFPLGSSVRLGL